MTWEWKEQPGETVCPWCGTKIPVKGYAERYLGHCSRCDKDSYEREYPCHCPMCNIKYAIHRIVSERSA